MPEGLRLDQRMIDRSIVVAHRDAPELLRWLRSALGGVGTMREVLLGSELENALLQHPPPDLVVASTGLSIPSSIAALMAARTAGLPIPFVIVAGFRDDRIRAFVSAVRSSRFEHLVLTGEELGKLANSLMDAHRALGENAGKRAHHERT